MATITRTTLVDDLDGQSQADETVRFGFEGREYQIDLTKRNAEDLRSLLEHHAQAGRRTVAPSRRRLS